MDIDHDSDIVQQARGVIAARLDVDIETAALILDRVAHREKVGRDELAADVVIDAIPRRRAGDPTETTT